MACIWSSRFRNRYIVVRSLRYRIRTTKIFGFRDICVCGTYSPPPPVCSFFSQWRSILAFGSCISAVTFFALLQCLPFFTTSNLSAFAVLSLLGGVLIGEFRLFLTIERQRQGFALQLELAAISGFAVLAGLMATVPDANILPRSSTLDLTPRPPTVTNVTQLGLPKPAAPQIVFVGAHGCAPCAQALRYMPKQAVGVKFYFYGNEVPDQQRQWTRLPLQSEIATTPSIFFVDQNGDVKETLNGFSLDKTFLDRFFRLLTRPSKQGTNP